MMMDNHHSNMTVAIWIEVKNLMIAYSRKFEDCARATSGNITMHCMPQHACMIVKQHRAQRLKAVTDMIKWNK
jgi:hypothetical protein